MVGQGPGTLGKTTHPRLSFSTSPASSWGEGEELHGKGGAPCVGRHLVWERPPGQGCSVRPFLVSCPGRPVVPGKVSRPQRRSSVVSNTPELSTSPFGEGRVAARTTAPRPRTLRPLPTLRLSFLICHQGVHGSAQCSWRVGHPWKQEGLGGIPGRMTAGLGSKEAGPGWGRGKCKSSLRGKWA